MLVSTKGRYALRVMVDLAEHQGDGRIPLKQIADRQDVSEKYLENILSTLVRNKVLTGMRGKGGGYRLTKDPSEFTVGQILRLTEGTLAPVACLNGTCGACPRTDECPTVGMWTQLDTLISSYLDGVTIEDLRCAPRGLDYTI
ncbi:Rrf2 family transcriptional regulator [Collinsella sp. BA40]|uniref:RrF2 family transcriptional regulator n=1 Tax=Collinsella sp. BA40 TaxID=2560852 RepID=UPI0011CC6715|nr:Rrf2 family transcriptional regulator [Collinsella sp. BA40]TXF35513.1 Rrf2 family transcriptional regulator [Collinsella sp. BA40]